MQKRILIIDDEEDMRVYLETLLARAGYSTAVAENGDAGVDMAVSFQPDLITLDLMMPKQSGIKAYQRLKGSVDTRRVPILVLTGLGRQKDFFGGGMPQPEAVMDKPIDRDNFLSQVSQLLGN
jgi:CheY-like chemotaxis protein